MQTMNPIDENMIITPADWVVNDSTIKVFGVGGGGCNAVSYMHEQNIEGCSFIVCNTDSQALSKNPVGRKVQMGRGLGAGTDPIKGRNAALESIPAIEAALDEGRTEMLFLTAGMGGGTGTGAAPVIAKMARDRGILTVAVVTIPFRFEGKATFTRAIEGLQELESQVDSLLVIDNEKLNEFFGDLLISDAFHKADEILSTAVRGIIDIIKKPGLINVDFQDVQTMMRGSGMALMGCGYGCGSERIDDAVSAAFTSPLLGNYDLSTAKNVLINVYTCRGEKGLTMNDYETISTKIVEYTGITNRFKSGLVYDDEDPQLKDGIKITAIATGFKATSLVNPDGKDSNFIKIGPDFVYSPEAVPSDATIVPDSTSYPAREGSPAFRYDPDRRPALLTSDGSEINELETTPAIRRK